MGRLSYIWVSAFMSGLVLAAIIAKGADFYAWGLWVILVGVSIGWSVRLGSSEASKRRPSYYRDDRECQ